MSFYMPPWEANQEPNQTSIRQYLDNLYSKFQPIEQARWNQANIDTLFRAGSQSYINRHFNYAPTSGGNQEYYFNVLQQAVNMPIGYQRQHRKRPMFVPCEGGDSQTTDQYTRAIYHAMSAAGIDEQYSRGCELSAISGMVLAQPYLDFTSDDPAQGDLKLKIWEYNSFLVDPYFRNYDMSDAQFFWCQEYISKKHAEELFPDKAATLQPMTGSPQRYGSFYFLPENYNMARNDLLVLSYVWYKWKRKRKKLYSKSRNQFFDFSEKHAQIDPILQGIPDLELVEVDVPTWKLAVVLNDQLMFQGNNPLGFDSCPVVPIFWEYDPHVNYYDLRVRSLVRSLRAPQFLLNRQIIISHDQKESVINSGYIRKVGAVANEDNLKKTGQGWDVIINEGYEIGPDFQKIEPNYVPESDFALADRMQQMIFSCSGINLDNWSAQEDKQSSALTTMLKQGANLTVLQKYFDQWDFALKCIGDVMLKIILENWNAAKVGMIIGEEPSPLFFSSVFAKYQVVVEEGLNTATQKNMQAQQLMDINAMFGREVFPPSMIIKDMNLSGRAEAVQFLQQQEQMLQAQSEHAQTVAGALEEAKLKELYSKAASNVSMAQERKARAESNIGLFEERLSRISRDHAASTKDKVEALAKLLESVQKYGEIEAHLKMNDLQTIENTEIAEDEVAKMDARRQSLANDFAAKILGGAA